MLNDTPRLAQMKGNGWCGTQKDSANITEPLRQNTAEAYCMAGIAEIGSIIGVPLQAVMRVFFLRGQGRAMERVREIFL